jgi:hypothetical protein
MLKDKQATRGCCKMEVSFGLLIICSSFSIIKIIIINLGNIPGKHEIKELQKSHIVHCTHIAESADVNVQNILHERNNITCGTNCKYRTAAKRYILKAWFVSGI